MLREKSPIGEDEDLTREIEGREVENSYYALDTKTIPIYIIVQSGIIVVNRILIKFFTRNKNVSQGD